MRRRSVKGEERKEEKCPGEEVHQEEELQVGRANTSSLAARVDAPERSLHLVLILRQTVLKSVTLDVEELVLHHPGDRQRGQRSEVRVPRRLLTTE